MVGQNSRDWGRSPRNRSDAALAARAELDFDAKGDVAALKCLASTYETISVDWPGFGDRAKPEVDWRPEAYVAFLDHLVTHIVPQPLQPVQQDMRQTMRLPPPLLSQVRWVGCA